ncbi:pre-mRNA splicing factor component-domain-containing protein [Scenedesmus sp. NREL 46B-D3]|nr:pre-mRNA splicing factor component-domain-containing protein [Scenedesmus sp. NREL 46B-D3]
MRIMIKGGVWKNTEDEILKAAVMKYGLNQWARISSLMVRKSAKQCKARWYEWLDPSIKKTEWTREEDEKLLHLAKLMPTQWRTIAPIVGRTPAQCLDRYERLLDMALGKDGSYDPADDPRRLRPGEIDPNPESKPARPDAIDMEEDEKEMLAEARARLANTRGKKAKRKAREKQLEEARRLASLQKKRELKAAGIEMRGKERKTRGIDYNAEVAFERKPVPGFYDTGDEARATKEMQQEFRPTTVEEMEGKRRKDIEDALMKRDVKRQKLAEGKSVPELVARVNESNAAALRRRTKMMLPAPQVSEAELEAIARMGEGATLEAELAAGAGGEATRQLLGEYQTPARFATPMRTPRATVGGQDSLMQQAANLAKLRDLQTPLLGGENPELVGMDYSGIVPQRSTAATPNPLAAAAAAAGMTPAGPGATPGLGRAGSGAGAGGLLGATPGRSGSGSIAGVSSTPSALAVAGGATPGGAALLASVRGGGGIPGATPMRIRDHDLRAGLAGLPAAENEYSVALPELLDDEAEAAVEEDAVDVKARRAREAEAARQAEERKKSQVLQRGLPRPVSIQGLPQPKAPAELAAMSLRERAEAELVAELAALVEHDNAAHPIAKDAEGKGKKDKKRRAKDAEEAAPRQMVRPLQQFGLDELDAARALLAEEARGVAAAMGHEGVAAEEYLEAWRATVDEWVLDGKGGAVRKATATPAMRIDAVRRDYERTRREMESQAHRAARLDKKAAILVAGLQQRHAKLTGQLDEVAQQVHDAQIELTAFQALQQQEQLTAPDRIERLKLLLQGQRDREVALQQQFRQLGQQRDDLREQLQTLQQQRKQQQQQQRQWSLGDEVAAG